MVRIVAKQQFMSRVILTQFGLPQLHAQVIKQFKPQLYREYLKPWQLMARA